METPDEVQLRAALDKAVRDYAATELYNDGEYIVAWVCCAGVIRADGGGPVITMPGPGESLPFWQMRGILADALSSAERQANRNSGESDGATD